MADEANPDEGEVSESTTEADAGDSGETAEGAVVEPDVPAGDDSSDDVASDDEASDEADDEANDDDDDEAADEAADYDEAASSRPRMSHVRLATIAGLVVVVALGGLTGWLGFQASKSHKGEAQRNLFLQVGRQGALNLTTIDWQHAEGDVQRILDSATGTFYDDFQKRSAPFVEVVKQAQSKSVGNVTEAGLESGTEDEGRVLVAVTVNTSNAGAPEQQPRSWRMRITVQKVENEAKVSNVEFVP